MRALLALLAALFVAAPVLAQPAPSAWDNVARVVVIGDLHGDDAKFVDQLTQAGLIDAKGDWAGGATHLVQLGDVPDRGPDTRRILDRLIHLEPQARRAGGYVHALIGNHEAMMVEGDLRYVHPGEYAAFADRNSTRRRAAFYAQTVAALKKSPPPTGLPTFDDAWRAAWEAEHPLGWVEHRLAWAPTGRYGRWVGGHDAVIRINDTLYMHAGIGPLYPPASADQLNAAVRAALAGHPDPAFPDITANEQSPLWYRGLALNAEETEAAHVDALLARFNVKRIVVGHTKRATLVLPRFGGKVIVTDIAQPAGFPDPHAFLIQENGALIAVHRGQRVPMDGCGYFAAIAALDPPNGPAQRLVATCGAPQAAIAQ